LAMSKQATSILISGRDSCAFSFFAIACTSPVPQARYFLDASGNRHVHGLRDFPFCKTLSAYLGV
jgi:hypothetical protein